MPGAEECRKRAQEKIAQAEREPRHSRRLIDAAQAWILLARNLKRVEDQQLSARRASDSRERLCVTPRGADLTHGEPNYCYGVLSSSEAPFPRPR
jgi:hypothetical protein